MPQGFTTQELADLHFLFEWAKGGIKTGIRTPKWQRKKILKRAKQGKKRIEAILLKEITDVLE